MFKYSLNILIIKKDRKGKIRANIQQSKPKNEASVTEFSGFQDRPRLSVRRDDGHLFLLCWNNNVPEQLRDPITQKAAWGTFHLPCQTGTARRWAWCFVCAALAASDELSQPPWGTALIIDVVRPVTQIGSNSYFVPIGKLHDISAKKASQAAIPAGNASV